MKTLKYGERTITLRIKISITQISSSYNRYTDNMKLNLQACLNFLRAKGVAVEEIRADEIHDGNMKADIREIKHFSIEFSELNLGNYSPSNQF